MDKVICITKGINVAASTEDKGFGVAYDTVNGATLDSSFVAEKRYKGHVVDSLRWRTHSLAPLSFRGASYWAAFTLLPLITGEGRAHLGKILVRLSRRESGDLFSTSDTLQST